MAQSTHSRADNTWTTDSRAFNTQSNSSGESNIWRIRKIVNSFTFGKGQSTDGPLVWAILPVWVTSLNKNKSC